MDNTQGSWLVWFVRSLASIAAAALIAAVGYGFGQFSALHQADSRLQERIAVVEADDMAMKRDHSRFEAKIDQLLLQRGISTTSSTASSERAELDSRPLETPVVSADPA